MARETLLDQIAAVKSRRGDYPATWVNYELDRLKDFTVSFKTPNEFLADFVPIRLVTLIEVFVREQVREFVDHGEPYASRSKNLCNNVKFDFLLASSLAGKRFTLGDIVAHSISINNLEQFITIFEVLIDIKIKIAISTVKSRWEVEVLGIDNGPIIADVDGIFKSINEIFRVRHIVTHERPIESPYKLSDISEYMKSTGKFLSALEAVCLKDRIGAYPLTQRDMNMSAHASAEQAEAEMNALLEKLYRKGEPDKVKLKQSQEAWGAYCEAEAKLHASLEGGSMWPLIYSSERSSLTSERNARLRWWLEREEGQL